MIVDSVTAFVDCLRRSQLLPPTQLAELAVLERRHTEPRRLAAELVKRRWLTPFQVNRLLTGKASELVLNSYVLLEPLGEGGMGQVYKARNPKLDRIVALKLIRKDRLDNADSLRRFQREIRAGSRLDHPNIVRLLDADRSGDLHFLVMEYVEGIDLARLVRKYGPLPIEAACEYIRQAALGLEHACEHGLVHRDIKPANLLLAGGEGCRRSLPGTDAPGSEAGTVRLKADALGSRAVVKIADLGLARLLRADGDDSASKGLTRDGHVLGTVDYLAPEQATDSHAVDIRADLYSLGCTFYFLLTGQVPFPGGETLDKLYRHRFEEPVPVEKLRPEVPGAVAGVVRKLMAKAPEQRYQRPAMLAAELAGLQRRGFGRQPRPAAPDRVSHGVGSRWWVLSGTAAAFLLVTVLILSLGSGNPGPRSTGVIPASIAAAPPGSSNVKKVPGPSSPTTGGLTFREIGKFTSHSQMILAIAFTPDGRSILTGGDDVLVRMWDFPSGKKIREFQGHASPINSIAVSPDGRRLVTASGRYAGPDWSVRLWDAATGSELKRWDSHQQMVSRAFFSPDGRRVISASWDGTVRVWDAETGQSLQMLPANPKSSINSLALFAEGNLALVGCHDRTLRRFHLSGEGEMRVWQTGHSDRILDVVVAPDGRLAATASIDRSIRLWNIEKGNEVRVLAGHEGWVFSVRFSRDGTRLLSAAGDRTIRLWDPATGRELARASHPAGGVRCAIFSPDERHILSAGDDNIVRLWQLEQ